MQGRDLEQERVSMYLAEIKRIAVAAMVGIISAGLQLLLFNLLRTRMAPEFASFIAIECAIINNFLLNHKITFSSHKKLLTWQAGLFRFFKFNGVACGSLLIQLLVLFVGLRLWGRGLFIENLLVVSGMALGFVTNYIGYRLFIWR